MKEQQHYFKTRKLNVVKRMLELLDCECIATMSDNGCLEFRFNWTPEVFKAYEQAKNEIYSK